MQPFRVCYPYVGDTIGGSHISSIHLIRGLPRQTVEPIVVLHREGPLAGYLKNQAISFERAPDVRLVESGSILSQLTTMAAAVPSLAKYLRSRAIDIVHTNDGRMHFTWCLAAKAARVPFIWHQRSADPSRRLSLYSRLAGEVLTVSNFCKSELPGVMGRRAAVITNPFEAPCLAPEVVAERRRLLRSLSGSGSVRVVGFVGNLTTQKRPQIFVRMAARLRETAGEDLVFPMFGEAREPIRQEVEALVRQLGLEGRCPLMGMQTPIEPWIAACDVITTLGVREAFGRAVVEPTLIGTPIVAANDGGNPEIISHGETGLLVTPDDVAGFESAVLRLLRDPEGAQAMADRAREHALRRYSIPRHVQEVLAVYHRVVGTSPSR